MKKLLGNIWKAVSFPLALMAIFYIGGFFFALGASNTTYWQALLTGKHIVISTIDLKEEE